MRIKSFKEYITINSINKNSIYSIIQFFEIKKYAKDTIIFNMGNKPKYFYIILSGIISIEIPEFHRIENPNKKPVKIIEAQVGSILKETDIIRYQDVYGRVN